MENQNKLITETVYSIQSIQSLSLSDNNQLNFTNRIDLDDTSSIGAVPADDGLQCSMGFDTFNPTYLSKPLKLC